MNNLDTIKQLGTNFTTTAEFFDSHKVKIEPDSVTLKYKTPSGDIVEEIILLLDPADYTYSTSVLLDEPGNWKFRWECTGEYAVADEFQVTVMNTTI